uniref:Ryanodine receptor 2-like n=1 Tax=Knipowitschia caucasica TaxID=637954 RepID=A0AAV2JJ13_KNICA
MADTDADEEFQFLRLNVHPDMSLCGFVLAQCLSVRALQEILSHKEQISENAILHSEGHMDDGLTLSRSQNEDSHTARLIRSAALLFTGLNSVLDLIEFFKPPHDNLDFEAEQKFLGELRKRQKMFQEEGILDLVVECIDQLHQYSDVYCNAESLQSEGIKQWEEIISYFYKILGALEVLHFILLESPEAVNMFKEKHIQSIVCFLDRHGYNYKVLEVLCSLCVCHGTAVRSNQNLIAVSVLPFRDMLLQTRLVNQVISIRPNIFLSMEENSAQHRKWYYEVVVDQVVPFVTPEPTHLRVGWASTGSYQPRPSGGDGWGCNGVGDDLTSFGFDGLHLWSGSSGRRVKSPFPHLLKDNDVVSCCLDLSAPCVSFRLNGLPVQGMMENFHSDGFLFPVVSLSAGVRIRFLFGGAHGEFRFLPPQGFGACCEALLPKTKLRIEPCHTSIFEHEDGKELMGPAAFSKPVVFIPNPIDISKTVLPLQLENIRRKMAENVHELWAMDQIELGWTFGTVKDEEKKIDPCLIEFSNLTDSEINQNIQTAEDTLKTILALGFHMGLSDEQAEERLQYISLSSKFELPSGYKPAPLVLSGVVLSPPLEKLVNLLAENDHNVWAKEHIRQGWAYGAQQDVKAKRSPYLVPYSQLDGRRRREGRERAREAVCILRVYGYHLESFKMEHDKSYAVTEGKWYFEFETVTAGNMRVGWARPGCVPDRELGSDDRAFVFSGDEAQWYHQGGVPLGTLPWQEGDVVSCMLDTAERTIKVALNGDLLFNEKGTEMVAKDFRLNDGLLPIVGLGVNQMGKLNLGSKPESLQYFSVCGLQEGYQPFADHMAHAPSFWLTWWQPQFTSIKPDDPNVLITKNLKDSVPSFRVSQRLYQSARKEMCFYRLNMSVECASVLSSPGRTLPTAAPSPLPSARKEQEELDSDYEMLMKSAHNFTGSKDELNHHKDHSHDKTSKLKQNLGRNTVPQWPDRLQVQYLCPVSWTRVPDDALRVWMDQTEDCRGWTVQCTEPRQIMSLQIPDENRVRMGKQEEKLMTDKLGEIINNKVFYQHPHLMRALGMHETVMEVMVNVLGEDNTKEIMFPKMVASCCRFLCYFCRISRQNQGALFDHLSYLLRHSQVGLASPSMRGSTPLDVAAASVMDNYELALSLQEHELQKVVDYLANCGVQSCAMLVSYGYPDIAWNPVEGERYLDFLRFTVFCNGESVEENAYVVLKLLIHQPECFGPALRGEGGQGLLSAMREAIRVSQDVSMDGPFDGHLSNKKYDNPDTEDDFIHMGHAIMTFYSSLIDLLGRYGVVEEPDLSAVFCPDHKASMVLFMDRVYGVESQVFLLQLLEYGFLPDLKAAVSLDTNDFGSTDMALALNRYITTAMLPMLTKCSALLCDLEEHAPLLNSFILALYNFSKSASLTKAQGDTTEQCLLAICNELTPVLMQPLLQQLIIDISHLSEHSKLELKLLTGHYDQQWKYYLQAGGLGKDKFCEGDGHMSRKLFWTVFTVLEKMSFEPHLYKLGAQCLATVARSLPPHFLNPSSVTDINTIMDTDETFDPQPQETSNVTVPERLELVLNKFAEHTHEKWSLEMFTAGWVHGEQLCENAKVHPLLKPYRTLAEKLAALIRHRISLFGTDAFSFTSCLQVLAQSLDARTLMHESKDVIYGSLHSFLDAAAEDLEMTMENLHVAVAPLSQSRSQTNRGVVGILSHTTSVLLPTLTSLLKHIGHSQLGSHILVGTIQVSCYRILNSLYSLGNSSLIQKDGTMSESETQELGLPEQVAEVCPDLPSLQTALAEVEKVVRAGAAAPQAHYTHVTEVLLPMLCSYMSHWSQPNMSQLSSVTPELVSDLLGHILCIIQNHVGGNRGDWIKQLADSHRASWLTEMNPDAVQLFSMVAEVFIFWAKSHNFKWEEQNYVVQNEINNLSFLVQNMSKFDHKNKSVKRKGERYCTQTSLIVASVKRLLPVGLNVCFQNDNDLIHLAKNDFSQIENPQRTKKSTWTKVLSKQRKRAVVACLRMTPLYNLPRHKVVNFFLQGYNKAWVLTEQNSSEEKLVEDLAQSAAESGGDWEENKCEERSTAADPLQQLITLFSQSALTDSNDSICKSYFSIMAESCHTAPDDDGEQSIQSFEEKELEKQTLLHQQAQLHRRGASEMVLQTVSASKGQVSSIIGLTLKLGIALLNGGNADVQQRMLQYLKVKQDVDFFQSMARLMGKCSVLDLNVFERQNKAEGLGMAMDERSVGIAMPDNKLTCDLFRFLQLLCEGHNSGISDFQSESISDFYWLYSGKDVIDAQGQYYFSNAIKVAKQVFNTLTEYIQGPCSGNQQSLAHSRLWDAVVGFLHVFAHMQMKLSQDSRQIQLLTEFMDLQKDMVVFLLSMLEGNVVNGTTGKQMVDMLVESSTNVEMILKFFAMFLKLKDFTTSVGFREYDPSSSGCISRKDFQRAMESCIRFSAGEILSLLACIETDENEILDYEVFVDRFHEPAQDIGFSISVLLTNLSEHMPYDARLGTFLELAECVLGYFQPYLGRIEIVGSGKRVERVYFEISESSRLQWDKPQVKESKRQFIFDVVNEIRDKEKMEMFVNFCEDTIFEMQLASNISSEAEERNLDKNATENESENKQDNKFFVFQWLFLLLSLLSVKKLKMLMKMSPRDIFKTVVNILHVIFITLLQCACASLRSVTHVLYVVFFSGGLIEVAKNTSLSDLLKGMVEPTLDEVMDVSQTVHKQTLSHASSRQKEQVETGHGTGLKPQHAVSDIFGLQVKKEGSQYRLMTPERTDLCTSSTGASGSSAFPKTCQRCSTKTEEGVRQASSLWETINTYNKSVLNYFARNYYNIRLLALFITFAINFILLFYKVTPQDQERNSSAQSDREGFVLEESSGYMEPCLGFLAVAHTFISFCCIIGYYCLKVPLVIFKREKEVARSLEFDGLYVTVQPPDEDIKGQWDRLVINTPSYPSNYWDKFVKRKVVEKYGVLYGCEKISELLGMDKTSSDFSSHGKKKKLKRAALGFLFTSFDIKYQIWKLGVILTDKSFLYLAWYMVLSVLGHYNNFFFAAHLLDVAMGFKTLRTILSSVTHNGKQLVLTVGLLAVVVYLYTVVAFNFFRKFYNKSEDEEQQDMKCNDMLHCYMFHMYVGVRAGGGIGDEIEDPAGDEFEVERIIFDITFFFFVIVILLAIIQGLIIDAFGELRDQQEQVKEDMETKCFICGIGNEYFDTVPHGFETHTLQDHNLANYLFFLMYLINKDETEYTGQESYVWKMYQERSWEFFPVGDCFRKQYEDQLT